VTSARRRARALEALALLLVSTGLRRWVPMHRWAPRLLGSPRLARSDPHPDAVLTVVDEQVGRAVLAASRRLPFEVTCLDQAVAGALMLRRRGVGHGLVIGLSARDATEESHAWLLGACDGVVLGDERRADYVPVSVFESGRLP
jgi:hypothetical protein